MSKDIVVGVLALQGAFHEHISLLTQAALEVPLDTAAWRFQEIRAPEELGNCNALIIPGGESTTVSLVAARSALLEPLREFVKHGPLAMLDRKLANMSHLGLSGGQYGEHVQA